MLATDVNNLNQSVGYYYSDSGEHSFFRDADGSLTYPLDAPGFELTAIFGLDDAGHMVGIAGNFDGTSSAVLLLSTSEVARYNYPGAVETVFTGINNSGIISGYWVDKQLASHALIVAATISEE